MRLCTCNGAVLCPKPSTVALSNDVHIPTCLTHGVLQDRLSSVITDSDVHLDCVRCQINGLHTTHSGNCTIEGGWGLHAAHVRLIKDCHYV